MIHDAPAQLRKGLTLRVRHERFLSELCGFAIASGAERPRAVCSWCGELVRDGNPALLISHTICTSCSAEFDAQPHPGGPLAESDDESSSDRVMESNLAAPASGFRATDR